MPEPLPIDLGLGARRRWRDLGLHPWIGAAVLAVLYGLLFRHEIGRMVGRWLTDASWSHGLLIPVFSLYFVNRRKDILLSLDPRPSVAGLIALVGAIGVYVFNLVSPSGYAYLRSVAVIGALGAMVLFLGGWRILRHTWLAVAYLLFAVPLPERMYAAATLPMRQGAAVVAASCLNWVHGVDATARGAVIDVTYHGRVLEPSLDVAEACSGMRLLMALLALGVAMAYVHERPWVRRMVLLASTLPIAVFCNTVRVVITGFLYVRVHPKYTQGVYHDLLGVTMLPLALGLYQFLAWFMDSLFVEERAKDIVTRGSAARTAGAEAHPTRDESRPRVDAPSPQQPRAPTGTESRSSRLAFRICGALLLVCGLGLSAVTRACGVHLTKAPLPLRKGLAELDEASLSPYRVVSKSRIRNPDVLKSLGTDEYIQWVLTDPTSPAQPGLGEVMAFVTYYGLPDRVPHVPEECYVGGGYQMLASDRVAMTVQLGSGPTPIEVRSLVFGPTQAAAWSSDERVLVLYVFGVNGRFAATRDEVRRALNANLFGRGSYFSKVELVFQQVPASVTQTQIRGAAQGLMQVLLRALERDHWPVPEGRTGGSQGQGND